MAVKAIGNTKATVGTGNRALTANRTNRKALKAGTPSTVEATRAPRGTILAATAATREARPASEAVKAVTPKAATVRSSLDKASARATMARAPVQASDTARAVPKAPASSPVTVRREDSVLKAGRAHTVGKDLKGGAAARAADSTGVAANKAADNSGVAATRDTRAIMAVDTRAADNTAVIKDMNSSRAASAAARWATAATAVPAITTRCTPAVAPMERSAPERTITPTCTRRLSGPKASTTRVRKPISAAATTVDTSSTPASILECRAARSRVTSRAEWALTSAAVAVTQGRGPKVINGQTTA